MSDTPTPEQLPAEERGDRIDALRAEVDEKLAELRQTIEAKATEAAEALLARFSELGGKIDAIQARFEEHTMPAPEPPQ